MLSANMSNSFARDLAIRPYTAVYTLFDGTTRVGKSQLTLEEEENSLRWQLESEATGIYALLTSKRPFSESIMHQFKNAYRLNTLLVSDNRTEPPEEQAYFDWQNRRIDIQRKGKKNQLELDQLVLDSLSVHWLAAQMAIDAIDKTDFYFYRRGKLKQSSLSFIGLTDLVISGGSKTVSIYQQSAPGSSTSYQYFYDIDNFLLPLKIEKSKSGKIESTMLFEKLL